MARHLHFISWEPEGRYQCWKMIRWEPEGHYCRTKSMVIARFWFSMEHLWMVIAPFWLSTDNLSSLKRSLCPIGLCFHFKKCMAKSYSDTLFYLKSCKTNIIESLSKKFQRIPTCRSVENVLCNWILMFGYVCFKNNVYGKNIKFWSHL